jgi:hypothetical protein
MQLAWIGVFAGHEGLPYMIRLVVPTLGLSKPKGPVGGMDVAERVDAVGRHVTRFRPAMRSLAGATGPTPSTPPLAKTTSRRNRRRGFPVRARRVHRRKLIKLCGGSWPSSALSLRFSLHLSGPGRASQKHSST